jgi:hypothetical protein
MTMSKGFLHLSFDVLFLYAESKQIGKILYHTKFKGRNWSLKEMPQVPLLIIFVNEKSKQKAG